MVWIDNYYVNYYLRSASVGTNAISYNGTAVGFSFLENNGMFYSSGSCISPMILRNDRIRESVERMMYDLNYSSMRYFNQSPSFKK